MAELSHRFATEFKGLFKLESTAMVIMEKYPAFEAALAIINDPTTPDNLEQFRPQFDEGLSVSLDSVSPLLTYIHEQDHFKVLSSTPVGLLLWRIEQCLAVDASYLRRRLPDVAPKDGRAFLEAWHDAAPRCAHPEQIKRTAQETAAGALLIRLFLFLLLYRANATIGQFVEIADHAFNYLALRSGLEPFEHAHWSTRLDKNLPLLRNDQPTLLEILEASARSRELTNLHRWRVTQKVLDQWRGRAIFGVYEAAFDQLMSELGSPTWAKTAIDLSLATPIDISAGKEGEVLYVEDVLPCYRLERIIRALRRRTWCLNFADPSIRDGLFEDLPRSVGLPSITDTYRRLADADYSLQAYWGGRVQVKTEHGSLDDAWNGEDPGTRDYLNSILGAEEQVKFVEEQYRRYFRLRVDEPTHFLTSQSGALHQPVLTFFSDRLVVAIDYLKNNQNLIFSAFHLLCDREAGRAYVFGPSQSDLPLFKRLFRDWCVANGVPSEVTNAVLRLRSLIESRPDRGFGLGEIFDS
jgi:hypothetical protein